MVDISFGLKPEDKLKRVLTHLGKELEEGDSVIEQLIKEIKFIFATLENYSKSGKPIISLKNDIKHRLSRLYTIFDSLKDSYPPNDNYKETQRSISELKRHFDENLILTGNELQGQIEHLKPRLIQAIKDLDESEKLFKSTEGKIKH